MIPILGFRGNYLGGMLKFLLSQTRFCSGLDGHNVFDTHLFVFLRWEVAWHCWWGLRVFLDGSEQAATLSILDGFDRPFDLQPVWHELMDGPRVCY